MKVLNFVLLVSLSLIKDAFSQKPGERGPPANLPPDDTGLTGPPPLKTWEAIDLINAVLTNSLRDANLPDCSFMYSISGEQRRVTLNSNKVGTSYPPLKLLLDLPKSYVILNLKGLAVEPVGKWKINPPSQKDIANGDYRARAGDISCTLKYRKISKTVGDCRCRIGKVSIEETTGGSSPNSLKDIIKTRTGTRRTVTCIRQILSRGICGHFQRGT